MNNDFINTETAYDIIARCLKLTHLKENIYKDENGNSFILTKYGFEPAVRVNTQLLLTELMKHHEMTSEENRRLKIFITDSNNKIAKQYTEINNLRNEKFNLESLLREEGLYAVNVMGKKSKRVLIDILERTDITDQDKVDQLHKYLLKAGDNRFRRIYINKSS